ncbi:MAG TPA: hypothetical protein VKH13_14980 [Steroidobacteraceae bacterium]|nr:hypothetical protein [Steroidobacteraceae bacterium]
MASNLSALGVLAAALVLTACTATSGNVKPAQSAADSHNQPCVPQTGSRIAAENADQSVVASCYTSTDISRTGVPNAAQAVQILDPAVRVGH